MCSDCTITSQSLQYRERLQALTATVKYSVLSPQSYTMETISFSITFLCQCSLRFHYLENYMYHQCMSALSECKENALEFQVGREERCQVLATRSLFYCLRWQALCICVFVCLCVCDRRLQQHVFFNNICCNIFFINTAAMFNFP